MRKFLPKLFVVVFITLVGVLSLGPSAAYATSPAPSSAPVADEAPPYVEDPEVTFVGKAANRSNDFLNWTLKNYDWLCVQKTGDTCNNSNNPLQGFWFLVASRIVAPILLLFILGTAFVVIVTRGQNITIMKFIPRFMAIVTLVVFSYAIVIFLYSIFDIIQGFFLKPENESGVQEIISSKDLLYIDFPYQFTGYRALGSQYDESAFISLLLVKLTAITYYVMTGVLLVRKIILWFFLVVSPVFPLLIFYKPLRNTAKIWIGEFFRWILYAPLFALFLHGLVIMWRNTIPLAFDFKSPGQVAGQDVLYPTAINILLGGPGQSPGLTNSVNLPDTFALYVVSLIMLWVVILLPFLLLRVFLDYLNSLSFSSVLNKQVNKNFGFLNPRNPSGGPLPPTPPGKNAPAGMARQLPFMNKATKTIEAGKPMATPIRNTISVPTNVREMNEVLKTVNISVPKMTDIVQYEKSLLSQSVLEREKVTTVRETLGKIANPSKVVSVTDKQQFSQIREKLVSQKDRGNPLAGSVLNAASTVNVTHALDINQQLKSLLQQISHPHSSSPRVQQKLTTLRQQLLGARQTGNPLATKVLETAEKIEKQEMTPEQEQVAVQEINEQVALQKQSSDPVAQTVVATMEAAQTAQATQSLPVVNRVQQVSLEDYEEVRKMWVENYETLEPPRDMNGKQMEKEEWIATDVQKINEAITLLSAVEPQKVSEGMEMVGNILPFLLMGGFSKSEVVAYLKAKLAAAKSILESASKKHDEEDTMIDRAQSQTAAKEMTMEQAREIPQESNVPDESDGSSNQGSGTPPVL